MGIIAFVLARFAPRPHFKPNDRVNLVENGTVARFEGVVIAETPQGVLVDWPKGGSRLSDPDDLVRLVA
jgi:hypothetical protein